MKKSSKAFLNLAILVGAITACSIAWSEAYPSGTWRYKMTVSVDTPEGVKTGSAVREVIAKREPKIAESPGATAKLIGEAIVIDLGKRGVLFAVMNWNDYTYVFKTFPGPPGLSVEGIKYYSSLKNSKTKIENKHAPMFVYFKDISDPKTVKIIRQKTDPVVDRTYGKENIVNFPEAFGAGVDLKEITIEMTDEPITWSVDNYLPWLSSRKKIKGYLGGDSQSPFNDPSKTFLTGIEFKRD